MVAPDHIREMAVYIIDECVLSWGGVGGFVTEGFANMANHVALPGFDFDASYRKLISQSMVSYCL